MILKIIEKNLCLKLGKNSWEKKRLEIDAEGDLGTAWTVQPVEKDINCHVHKSMPLDPILSRKNPLDLVV